MKACASLVLVVLAWLATGSLVDRGALVRAAPRAPAKTAPARPVVPLAPAPAPLTLTGLVGPSCRAAVRSPVSGLVKQISLQEGQSVKVGQLLVQLDDTEARLELVRQKARLESLRHGAEEARLNQAIAQDESNRNDTLCRSGAVPMQTLAASRLLVQALASRLASIGEQSQAENLTGQMLEHRLELYRVTAPFEGVVCEVLRQSGTYVTQGEILLHLETECKEIRIQLPAAVPAVPALAFSLLHKGRRLPLERIRSRPGLNPDGSRTLTLQPPPDLELVSGQMVKVQALDREFLP